MAERHIPADEFTPRKQCANAEPHEDHYWREDGKRVRYVDTPGVCYCEGVTEKETEGA